MKDRDKEKIMEAVASPMEKLSSSIIRGIEGKVAKKRFKEIWGEEQRALKQHCPMMWEVLPKAEYLYITGIGQERYSVPIRTHKPTHIPGVTGNSQSSWGNLGVVLEKGDFFPEYAEEIKTWEGVHNKLGQGRSELNAWIEQFEAPDQLPFSMPQILPFLRSIDFRQRRRWSADEVPKFMGQKRPRVIVPPSDSLKQFVVESALLKASLGNNQLEIAEEEE